MRSLTNPEHSSVGAARHSFRRRRLREQASVARPAVVMVDRQLALQSKGRSGDEGTAGQAAGVADEVPRGDVVARVDDHVEAGDQVETISGREALVEGLDLDRAVQRQARGLGGLGLGHTYAILAVDDLPVEVRLVHNVAIDDPEPTHPGRGEIIGDRRPEASSSDDQHAARADFFLP